MPTKLSVQYFSDNLTKSLFTQKSVQYFLDELT